MTISYDALFTIETISNLTSTTPYNQDTAYQSKKYDTQIHIHFFATREINHIYNEFIFDSMIICLVITLFLIICHQTKLTH